MNSCAECWFYSLSLAADGFRCFEFLIPSDYEWEVFVLIFFFCFFFLSLSYLSLSGDFGVPGEGTGTPLQYSCLENPMDGGV